VFIILVVVLFVPGGLPTKDLWVPVLLVAVTFLFLARYLSTTYSMNDSFLRAARILGGRRVRLEEVRKIEYANLRDLGSTGGMLGGWGWRGRMWSPLVGHFDAIFTDPSQGLLVSADGAPLYITPVDRVAFARELSRRVRSYTGPLEADVGDPRYAVAEATQ
jgi:energy-coupling factor transporter transmembrane protein EcfT